MTRIVTIRTERITDWHSFHTVFQEALGFPDSYGRNMDAWIDCLTSVDSPADGLTTIHVDPGEMLSIRIDNPSSFRQRCPEQYEALIECSAFVNYRRIEAGTTPVIALLFVGPSCI